MATLIEDGTTLRIATDCYEAVVTTEGYVSGVGRGSFVDRATGARDPGFGLMIADFLMEPGWDDAWTDEEAGHRYSRDVATHGRLPKRYVELPQICTQAKTLPYEVFRGEGFVAVRQWFHYREATAGRKAGSRWEQTLLFPDGQRFFFASDRITSVNDVDALLFRQDVPGHLKHQEGDTFEQVYLSYHGCIPAGEFASPFAPDERFLYHRGDQPLPERMIRAYQVKKEGMSGPWLAGMTLDPAVVYEGWCHERGYVCFIQEIGGFPVRAGETLEATSIVGWFDDVPEMERAYDAHRGASRIEVSSSGWRLASGASS
jgi:hypothetical protein